MDNIGIKWDAITAHSGSQNKDFEALCTQLADEERPADSTFVAKGDPDAGVECFAALPDGSEIGWQAKYLSKLEESGLKQIDKSVKAALEKHPLIQEYIICLPMLLPDAREGKKKSARDKWETRIEKWKKWANTKGLTVEFTLWDAHQLEKFLVKQGREGMIRYFFDQARFGTDWFSAHIDRTILAIGDRYTPKLNLEVPITEVLSSFSRYEIGFDAIKQHAAEIRKCHRQILHREDDSDGQACIDAKAHLDSAIEDVVRLISSVDHKPAGCVFDAKILERIRQSETLVDQYQIEVDHRLKEGRGDEDSDEANQRVQKQRTDRYHRKLRELTELRHSLSLAYRAIKEAIKLIEGNVLLLRGESGIGKTHLLADIASKRVKDGLPTILLQAKRIDPLTEPWAQCKIELDVEGLPTVELIGALEAAARQCQCRALIIIDALNESPHWPAWRDRLADFLAAATCSEWIGVVLSVGSAYEEKLISESVREEAYIATHYGFSGLEFEAVTAFFDFYDLELPSTPLLAPEFSKPLFLSSLCIGLQATGQKRLPRGHSGVTSLFNLFFGAMNEKLFRALDVDPSLRLVNKALAAVTTEIQQGKEPWLRYDDAVRTVDALLPGKAYSDSLFAWLLGSNLLDKNLWHDDKGNDYEYVRITYDRFADYLAANSLLESHFDDVNPTSCFAKGAPLAFISEKESFVSPGLLEAMSVLVPERSGTELLTVAPEVASHWGAKTAFWNSLVWRAPTAFNEETKEVLNRSIEYEDDVEQSFEALLTLSTVVDHPYNAEFLDRSLLKLSMPERDAWWSTAIHSLWAQQGAIDRLVHWAQTIELSDELEAETVDLCGITLAWMLTSSNRSLRDNATQALVCLFTERHELCVRLLDRFADIDDPYIAERLMAVAYGVAMRSHDIGGVSMLAKQVYEQVFSGENVYPHILLRDYARGVVERATHLGADLGIDLEVVRPPYGGSWPRIPTEEAIAEHEADWSRGSYDSVDPEWSHNRIWSSVMSDDFGRYIIGTNSNFTNWLELRIDEEQWRTPEERLVKLIEELPEGERAAWLKLVAAEDELVEVAQSRPDGAELKVDGSDIQALVIDDQNADAVAWQTRMDAKLKEFEDMANHADQEITQDHVQQFNNLKELGKNADERRPPTFDLTQIQRYIIWRVFDLGWTVEQFGRFDREVRGDYSRTAHKTERIGKKYQWIAYHEILSLVADNFQYRERFGNEDCDKKYVGPWQESLRDIDPSCPIKVAQGGTDWDSHTPSWWIDNRYDKLMMPVPDLQWLRNTDDLPEMQDLLVSTNDEDGHLWLNADCFLRWVQKTPPEHDPSSYPQRELWYSVKGYFIAKEDVAKFMEWAEEKHFQNRWMLEGVGTHRMFLGEHAWSPAYRYFEGQYTAEESWSDSHRDYPTQLRSVAQEYLHESSGYDCFVEDTITFRLPPADLIRELKLRSQPLAASFENVYGECVVLDPTANCNGPASLLLRADTLKEYCIKSSCALVWTIIGEKRVLYHSAGDAYVPYLELTGACYLENGRVAGFMKTRFDNSRLDDAQGKVVDEILRF